MKALRNLMTVLLVVCLTACASAMTLPGKTNFGVSTLSSNLASNGTTVYVATGTGTLFPQSGQFAVVVWGAAFASPSVAPTKEIMYLTIVSGDTFTAVRAQERTGQYAWNQGDHISETITAGVFNDYVPYSGATGDVTLGTHGLTAGSLAVSNYIKFDQAYDNIFLGYQSGFSNTTGGYNVFEGYQAGYSNIVGAGNVSIGYQAGYLSTGNSNLFIGNSAGYANTNSFNTFIGYYAGAGNSTGSSNVFIGLQAGQNETGSNKLYISNSSTSSPLIKGDFNANTVTVKDTLTATTKLCIGAANVCWYSGAGAPGINCAIGSLYSNTSGGANTTLYVCTATNTWTAK